MPDIPRRRTITSRISQTLKALGLESAICGKNDQLRYAINSTTGFWLEPNATTKPPRLLVHLEKMATGVEARLPNLLANGVIAYANTHAGRKVALINIRVIPVVQVAPNTYSAYEEWEWLLWFCFFPPLASGNSGEVFKNFNPAQGTFEYQGRTQPYIAAGLVKLVADEDKFCYPNTDTPALTITYGEATRAIAELINIQPAVSLRLANNQEPGMV